MPDTPSPYKVGDPVYRDGVQIGTVTAVTAQPAAEALSAGWEITVEFIDQAIAELAAQDVAGLSVYNEDPA